MASRVEKYYNNASTTSSKRTRRNKDLYKALYLEDDSYSNIEGVVETQKTNEIDISKVQELVKKQEEEEKKKSQLVKKDLEIPDMATLDNEEGEKSYDIRDILDKVAADKKQDDKPRKLKDFDVDKIKADLKEPKTKYTKEEQEIDINELKGLIDTISGNDSKLNELSSLEDDLFAELSDAGEKSKEESRSIKQIIEDAKKKSKDDDDDNFYQPPSEMDRSFYTKTLDLNEDDFVENEEEKAMPVPLKIFLILLFIAVAIVFVVVGYQVIKKAVL